jgi:ssRNA-specific RNase YbeY (16S rRNA maturation enzyme)
LSNNAEITVRVVGLDEGRALNHSYRKKDYATNVLTFDYAQSPVVKADLVLCRAGASTVNEIAAVVEEWIFVRQGKHGALSLMIVGGRAAGAPPSDEFTILVRGC